jgi:SWI/SNF-related matrix-associated actin-dependent regulator of chromatin subfamily A3
MTGTPLQNRLTDFASLLQFLRVFPYYDYKVFESHIVDVWKAQGAEAAIERLKKLVKYLTLRRSQATIELPERTDTIQYLDFSPEELVEYRQAESPIAEMLDDALNTEHHQSGMYMHALAKVNVLRKFCNLGLSAPTLKTEIRSKLHDPEDLAWSYATAQEAFENLVSLGRASCVQCCIDLDIPFQEGGSLADDFPRAHLTRCLRLTCDTCFQQMVEYPSTPICTCEDQESCSVVAISINRAISSPATPTPASEYAMDHGGLPTKIEALSVELRGAGSEKW